DHGTALALFPVLRTNLPTLLARADPNAEQVGFMHLHPVRSHVDVACVRIGIDDHVSGSYVTSAVALVTAEHGKFEQVYIGAGHNVFSDRRTGHLFWRNRYSRADFP